MTAVAIHQPNYLPWLGYFRKVAQADVFVFFDNVRMPMGKSFVSRNRIRTPQGKLWLTVPIERTSAARSIAETRIQGDHWRVKHVKTLETTFARSPWKSLIAETLAPVMTAGHEYIADLNVALIQALAAVLEMDRTQFVRATAMDLESQGAGSIPEILERTGASVYVTGSGAGTQRHLDIDALAAWGVETRIVSNEFEPYPQRQKGFEPNLSIVDVLLNCGPERCRELLNAH